MAAIGSTAARGYGYKHQAKRKAQLANAYGQPCSRCGQPMLPGQALHLDHTDDRTGYRGFSHARCNLRAGGRKGGLIRGRRRRLRKMIAREW